MAGSNFVDYVKIFARSGHGGAGSCHFRREKFVAFGGPDGGDGGKGGSIILQGDSQYWTLIHLKYKRHQFAEDGENGHGARSTGADAKDIIIPVPLGTVAKRVYTDEETGETYTESVGEVTEHGEQLVLLKGGRGGLGNWHFRTATNQTPRYAQPGEEGEEGAFILELKVLADVGLVGFPNAGKSTLLSVVSAAQPK
ncbi:MAG: GTPase ObgE, partial [Alistipes sp.]|nr:GTPase ObgE [Alistipes sp.]